MQYIAMNHLGSFKAARCTLDVIIPMKEGRRVEFKIKDWKKS